MEKVILRIDLNVAPEFALSSKKVKDIKQAVDILLSKNKKIIMISHYGRPSGYDNKFSLINHIPILSSMINRDISFFNLDEYDEKKLSDLSLMENIRFYDGEESCNELFYKKLASMGDIYINDALSVAHRAHASVVGIAKILPSYMGPSLFRDINTINSFINYDGDKIAVVGGAKIDDKIALVNKLCSTCKQVLLGGGIAASIRNSINPDIIVMRDTYINKLVFPIDIIDINGIECDLNSVNSYKEINSIGSKTMSLYSDMIKNGYVLWNGPLSFIENPIYKKYSVDFGKNIKNYSAQYLVGGGETTTIAEESGMDENKIIGAGGAFLEYISDGSLPGIEVLKNNIDWINI